MAVATSSTAQSPSQEASDLRSDGQHQAQQEASALAINGINGPICTITVRKGTRGRDIKLDILERTAIPVAEQRLYTDTGAFEDNDLVWEARKAEALTDSLSMIRQALTQPKKPVGGWYGMFLNKNREEFLKACPCQKASAVARMAGEAWRELSASQREPYLKEYDLAKVQYEKDMAAFLENGGEKAKSAAAVRKTRRELKAAEKAIKRRDPNAPRKPAGGAFGVFLADKREDIKNTLPAGHKPTDVPKKAGEMWKGLAESEKQKYDTKYKVAQDKYTKEIEAYMNNYEANDASEDEKPAKRAKAGA